MLTGEKVCEYTIASSSGMMDQTSRQFNKALLQELGIRTDVLLPIVQPGEKTGEFEGIPVIAVAGHDTASAMTKTVMPDLIGHLTLKSSPASTIPWPSDIRKSWICFRALLPTRLKRFT